MGGQVNYAEFLASKAARVEKPGREVAATDIHPMLHPWQNDIVRWAVRTGRAAIWADTGLGKTFMMVEWARLSGSTALIVAPLAVCQQTIREAAKLNVPAQFARSSSDITGPGLYVTNYERVESVDPSRIDAVALDESSILKQSSGKTRNLLIDHFAGVSARLACSATPAPNDPEELTNQAEFLGHMLRREMLSAYFKHTQGVQGGSKMSKSGGAKKDSGWRIKGHAKGPLVQWMSGWAVALRTPSDIGGDDAGYILPGLEVKPVYVEVPADVAPDGQLFAAELGGVTGRARIRKSTATAKVAAAVELVEREPDEPWLLWVGQNAEADALAAEIPGAVNVYGSMDPQAKADALLDFADGHTRVLITKPSIASRGMNFQHCARMVFVGLSDSYEDYYQCVRRCYRYGQPRVVQAYIVLSDIESQIATNVNRKARQASEITELMVAHARSRRGIALGETA